ncbi:fimbria/pilus periplasmic chaperone [uncultured Algimonas sp.]|uniref:fimbrial biogenesis chaperone n=1 Tax=uncultured Algimonas sp. TaxID=1547920 RepID=UPI0026358476|nr:fimbria/pilus periplasmic chaperone [uncultured Algimonas sp.]
MKIFAILSVLLMALSAASGASAYEVSPMRQVIEPSRGVNTGLITITNTRSEPLPVEIVVMRRTYDDEGEQTLVEDDSEFVVFPPQALIEPGQSQAVRFQYLGDIEDPVSRGYVLDVREIPVELDGFSGFRFVYNFGVAVYVRADKAESDLTIENATVADDVLMVKFRNDGRYFGRLTNDRLDLKTRDGKDVTVLEGDTLMSRLENPMIPPAMSRTVRLDVSDLDLPDGPVDIRLRETRD